VTSTNNIHLASGNFVDGGGEDLVVSVSEQVLFYQLDGTKSSVYSVEPASDIATGDIDGDALAEFFIAATNSNRVSIYNAEGKLYNTFNINNLAENEPLSITTADIDGDGVVDKIIVGVTEDKVAVYDVETMEVDTFSVFQQDNTRQRSIRKKDDKDNSGNTCDHPGQGVPKQCIDDDGDDTNTGDDTHADDDTNTGDDTNAGENTNQGLVSNATISSDATLSGGKTTGSIDNQGTVANTEFVGAQLDGGYLAGDINVTTHLPGLGELNDVTILHEATVSGATLTGEINNQGTLSDVTIKPNTTVTGGLVQNHIENNGLLQNITTGEDTYIEGGVLTGIIAGHPDDKPLIEGAQIQGADLSHVIIGEGTQLGPDVVIGAGTIFADNAMIPEGADLSLSLLKYFPDEGAAAINMGTDVLAETLVYEESDALGLLKQINALPKLKDNDWLIEQNPNNGQLELTIEGIYFVLIPVQVTQVSSQEPAGLTVHDDDSITFVTGLGREILAQPMVQDMAALLSALSLKSDEIIVQNDGTLKVKTSDGWKISDSVGLC